ncbi:hypothetical protein PENSUB_7328 [Penicillium subrubescens]|jgi:hypothetical protein|uniref:Uncharacterized protein n=1 Tax=Penicillium subrubescens TaxID=1316194 RepID=A0A1Q5TM83_9EURO|nr:hypothetical protein PENSUB_7328 [Penicillium subrubescens]
MSDKKLQILTISLSRHLTGHPINDIITKNWSQAPDNQANRFNNVGFDFDGKNVTGALDQLKETLAGHPWDGILVGWCIRGKPEHTAIFERIMAVCIGFSRGHPEAKVLFCTGPDNLVEATLRNFP